MLNYRSFVINLLALLFFFTGSDLIAAQSNGADKSAQQLFGTIVTVVVRWIFPILSLFCGLYGIARGIKKGEWDFAVMCIGAAIVLAILPSAIQGLFGVDFNNAVNDGLGK